MVKFPYLFSPIEIAGHVYKNRILCPPMIFGFMCLQENISESLHRIIEGRAKGGAAEVVVGETPVNGSDAPDFIFPDIKVDYTNRSGREFDAYKRYADVIKKYNAFALIEIFHAGHAKNPLLFGEKTNPWGPMGFLRDDGVTVEAFDTQKMKKVRDDFVTCALFMKAAGFDGVCLHGGHGFLFTQFLSPSANRRTDEYGGSLENRGRFPREILGDLRKNLGKDFIIELRINGADLVDGSSTNEQMADFCSTLDGLVDIIHVSSGFKNKGYSTQEFSSHYEIHGVNVERAANIKKKTKIPVAAVGGINSPEFAESIIAEGKVDMVCLGRQLIADPEFPNKAVSGREDEIRRCIRCYHCYTGGAEIPGDTALVTPVVKPGVPSPLTKRTPTWKCTINPVASNEVVIENMPKPQGSRKVLIVGGGPAGMQAAITAFDRGHQVTLVEKSSSLGGLLCITDTDLFKADLRNFKNLLIREVGARNIKAQLSTEATPEFITKFKPDVLILALGASPTVLPIPGINSAIHVLEVYNDGIKIGKKVLMVGGGLAGCETALHLADKGHEVIIIEMLGRLASETSGFALTATIRQIEKRSNITNRTGVKCVAITHGSVKVECANKKVETIQGDTIVYSLGMSAKRAETERLRAAAGNDAIVYEVGDCVHSAKVFEAVSDGFMAAMKIS